MAITQDSSATSSIDGNSQLTFALTVAAGATKLIVQAIYLIVPGEDIRKVQYAGVNLTNAVIAKNASSTASIEIWYLDNPASGTNDVVVETIGTGNLRATATSLFGTLPGAPEDTDFLSDEGPGTEVTLTLTGTAGAWLFDAISSSVSTVTPNDTQTLNLDYDVETNRGSFDGDDVETGTSTGMRWDYALDVVGVCAVRIAPAPTGRLNMIGDGLQWSLHTV